MQPQIGIIKCPKCNKYFRAAIGTLSVYVRDEKDKDMAKRLIDVWEKGERKCPYCLKVIPPDDWRNNIVKNSYENIKKIQGSLREA